LVAAFSGRGTEKSTSDLVGTPRKEVSRREGSTLRTTPFPHSKIRKEKVYAERWKKEGEVGRCPTPHA